MDDNGNNQNNERRPDIEEDDDENENLRKKSRSYFLFFPSLFPLPSLISSLHRLEAKYRELSEGYLINPSSKLLVKRYFLLLSLILSSFLYLIVLIFMVGVYLQKLNFQRF